MLRPVIMLGLCALAAAATAQSASDAPQSGAAAPVRSADGSALTFICYGTGSGPTAQSYSGYSYNRESRKFEPTFGTTLGRAAFSSDVQIEISNGLGRIHLAGKLVSPIHSGGVDGWWPIEGLMVTPDRITGRYRMNGMNQPRLDLDRRSGIIRIKAATDFSGRCDIGAWRSGR